ncbi:MAG: uncharacterized membrane protein YqaE (UPF0057 family) [Myxococcota bacterium]|jgi:uncharacterized membrane protein YqaE (UPF0057 family)
MGDEGRRDFWRVIFAWFFPPLGVFLQVGLGAAFWINILLVCLGGFPGILHALWVISSTAPGGGSRDDGGQTFISLLLCGLLPPLGVFMKRGMGVPFLVNIVLTLFFWIPGMIHAVWLITSDD